MKALFEKIFVDQNIDLTEKWVIKMKEAISELPEKNATICELYYLGQKKRKQIATELNCSLSTVDQRIARAICILRRKLNPIYYKDIDEIGLKTTQRLLRKCEGLTL